MLSYLKRIDWKTPSINEIKQRARLLVIDDIEFPYLDFFLKDGYSIDKWDDIEDIKKLEQGYYDVILLDLNGVGKKYSNDHGLGILKHIKQSNPTQLVIAYSNSRWGLDSQKFFDLADAKFSKSEDYVVFKREIDELLTLRFSKAFYVEKLNHVSNIYGLNKKEIIRVFNKTLLKKSINYAEKQLDRNGNKESIDVVLSIIKNALGIWEAITKFF